MADDSRISGKDQHDDHKYRLLLESQLNLENVHIYIWILKDYAWASNNYYLALIFGSGAVAWMLPILVLSACRRDYEDLYFLIATSTWLIGNFMWMIGEVTVDGSIDGPVIEGNDDSNTLIARNCFFATLTWLFIYYAILKPTNIITTDPRVTNYYQEELQLYPPKIFDNWRTYEYVHMVCWCSKDLFWNELWAVPWLILFFVTFSIAIHFIVVTFQAQNYDGTLHYTAQFLWVLANFAWGYSEQFFPDYDDPISVTRSDRLATETGRWWAQVLLIVSMQPLAILIFFYHPYQLYVAATEKENGELTKTKDGEEDEETSTSSPDHIEMKETRKDEETSTSSPDHIEMKETTVSPIASGAVIQERSI